MTKPWRVYLAARYSRRIELHAYANALRQRGIVVTSRWLDGSEQLLTDTEQLGEHLASVVESNDVTPSALTLKRKVASNNIDDIHAADTFIAFTEPPDSTTSPRGGRHVEFGIAGSRSKQLIVIGYYENLFYCGWPLFNTFHDYITALEQL